MNRKSKEITYYVVTGIVIFIVPQSVYQLRKQVDELKEKIDA